MGASGNSIADDVYDHFSQRQKSTDLRLASSIRRHYPDRKLVITDARSCSLVSYANAGNAIARPHKPMIDSNIVWRNFSRSTKPLSKKAGSFVDVHRLLALDYAWQGHNLIVYIATLPYAENFSTHRNAYVVYDPETTSAEDVDQLIMEATEKEEVPDREILVYDQGEMEKDAELYSEIERASWNDVILDEDTREGLERDVLGFFDSKELYDDLAVAWKRGIICHGEPGNGKTATIRVLISILQKRSPPIPTIWVKSFNSECSGPQWAIHDIFEKARATAPCFIVLEDLDTLVTDDLRSYFLNEVDGLDSNSGILMVGTTNHLDKLDIAVSRRPSRFDRKYHFAVPSEEQRIAYCEYWQLKLKSSQTIAFPPQLCRPIAQMTEGMSFAYMKEAFVATLLVIGGRRNDGVKREMHTTKERESIGSTNGNTNSDGEFAPKDWELWREMERQVKILQE